MIGSPQHWQIYFLVLPKHQYFLFAAKLSTKEYLECKGVINWDFRVLFWRWSCSNRRYLILTKDCWLVENWMWICECCGKPPIEELMSKVSVVCVELTNMIGLLFQIQVPYGQIEEMDEILLNIEGIHERLLTASFEEKGVIIGFGFKGFSHWISIEEIINILNQLKETFNSSLKKLKKELKFDDDLRDSIVDWICFKHKLELKTKNRKRSV